MSTHVDYGDKSADYAERGGGVEGCLQGKKNAT